MQHRNIGEEHLSDEQLASAPHSITQASSMTIQNDDLAAQMVREMGLDSWFIQDEVERCEAIARRYMEGLFTEDDIINAFPGQGYEIIREIKLIRAKRAGKDGR